MAKKKQTVAQAKKKLWDVFSKYIRLRDALATTKTNTDAKCCTCGRVYPIHGPGAMHAGHWIPGRRWPNLCDERGVHAQCYGCNVGKHGNPIEYMLFMENKYGREIMDELMAQDKSPPSKLYASELMELRQYYLDKINELGGWPS